MCAALQVVWDVLCICSRAYKRYIGRRKCEMGLGRLCCRWEFSLNKHGKHGASMDIPISVPKYTLHCINMNSNIVICPRLIYANFGIRPGFAMKSIAAKECSDQ